MEQKHLDDLDDSFVGEEFIEEGDLLSPETKPAEVKAEVKVQKMPSAEKKQPVKKESAQRKKASSRVSVKKEVAKVAKKEGPVNAVKKLSGEKTVVPEIKILSLKESPAEKTEEKKSLDKSLEKKTPLSFASPPVDPWKEESQPSSWLDDVSTWKALTGIVVVVLILSVFTQGFSFSQASGLSPQEAEATTIKYVNTYLLRPPFTAESLGVEAVEDLFKVTLSVAGETVDSYLTRDGKLFFPQGFAVAELPAELAVEESTGEEAASVVEDTVVEDTAAEDTGNEANGDEGAPAQEGTSLDGTGETEAVAEEPADEEPSAVAVSLTLQAKKWLFSPNKVTVKEGSVVELTVVPSEVQFTFALPAFKVEEEVAGTTTLRFTADKKGEFTFLCSSCEDWRGMAGTLVVE